MRHKGDEREAWTSFVRALATNLRRARVSAGLSQEEVAYRAGLSRYTYQKFEKGESRPGSAANPTLSSILAICQVLSIELEELIPRDVPDLTMR